MSFLSLTTRLLWTRTRDGGTRWIASATTPLRMPLDEFRDSISREKRMQEPVGRPWSVKELRRKSYDDMHKLWYERRFLLSGLAAMHACVLSVFLCS